MALPPAMPMPPDEMTDEPMADEAMPEDAGGSVLVTIVSNGDGTFVVYAGDEPDEAADPMAGGPMAGEGMQGQPAADMGAALKMTMDIMTAEASAAGAPGSADEQFAAGFGADKEPAPAMAGPGRGR